MALKEIYKQKSKEELLERYKDYNNYREDVKIIILEELKTRNLISDEEIEKKLNEVDNNKNTNDISKEPTFNDLIQNSKVEKVSIDKEDEKSRANEFIIKSLIGLAVSFLLQNLLFDFERIWYDCVAMELIIIILIMLDSKKIIKLKTIIKVLKITFIIIALLIFNNFIEDNKTKKEIKSYIKVTATILEIKVRKASFRGTISSEFRIKYKYYINGNGYIGIIDNSRIGDKVYNINNEYRNKFIIFVSPKDDKKIWYDPKQFYRKKVERE